MSINPTTTMEQDQLKMKTTIIPEDESQEEHLPARGDEPAEEEEEEDYDGPLTPPPAPIKAPRRRRLALLERWRATTNNTQLRQRRAGGTTTSTHHRMVNKKSAIEDFYRVDTVNAIPLTSGKYSYTNEKNNNNNTKQVKVLLPGVPRYEDDWSRDSHDYFNLIVLVPVTVLNVMNWNWDVLFSWLDHTATTNGNTNSNANNSNNNTKKFASSFTQTLQRAWTGDWFDVFLIATMVYFLTDLLWIWRVPTCVKSPGIIRLHHIAVLLFLIIPYYHPPVRYCMGACLTVELNTWFLIARRVFNKQGFPPWTVLEVSSWSPWSIRVKVISIAFYVTWIGIRCFLYPALLLPFYKHWREWSRVTGTSLNILLPSVPLHAAFCLLNLKWTYELIMSKVRYHRRQRRLVRSTYNNNNHNNNLNGAQQQQQQYYYSNVDKGL